MNFNDGNVFYIADFDDTLEATVTLPFVSQVQKQRRYRDGRIDLYINSFGGYSHLVDHLLTMIEVAKRHGTTIRTIVTANAFSAGSMLAIAGTPGERYIARHGEHLIHYGSTGSVEETPKQVERWSEYKRRSFKYTLEHYKKYASVPNLDSEVLDDGFFVPAAKCIKFKLADKYTDKLDTGDYFGDGGGMPLMLG